MPKEQKKTTTTVFSCGFLGFKINFNFFHYSAEFRQQKRNDKMEWKNSWYDLKRLAELFIDCTFY